MYQGILGGEICESKKSHRIFRDCNIGVCISRINSLAKGYDLREVYTAIPSSEDTVEYRRQISRDMEKRSVRETFILYSTMVERAKKQKRQSRFSNHPAQSDKWHLDALTTYVQAVDGLYQSLSSDAGLSDAMGELVEYLKDYCASDTFTQAREMTDHLQTLIREHPITFSIQKNKVILEPGSDQTSFAERMEKAFGGGSRGSVPSGLTPQNPGIRDLSLLEMRLAEQTVKLAGWDKDFRRLEKFQMEEALLQLATDVQYYIGFYRFAEEMKDKGYSFCIPDKADQMSLEAGYDLAMAVQSDKPVISNDFQIRDGERFFVITGANGGGKTTFARMIGQVLYFSRMGLPVPCKRALIPHFDDIMTHFSDEESEMSGRGKLVEELERLGPMMQADKKNSFVIIIELFTTAATMDASIMGQRVLDYFIANHCCGIYVTHIQSLATPRDGVVSMVAELESDHHTRSYRISRKSAEEGEYDDSLITKYHMTYDKMEEVIGCEC